MKNVLVTGASGFIGGRFAFEMAQQGYHVIAPLRSKSEVLIKHKMIKEVFYEGVKNQQKTQVNAIIHCAALTTANSTNGSLIYETNISLAKQVCEWIDLLKPDFVAFMSTVSVYGTIKAKVLSNDSKIINPNQYGQSKLIAEKILRGKCLEQNISFLNLRLPGTVGYGSHGNIVTRILDRIKSPNGYKKRILLKNPKSMFNNVVCINTLMDYVISTMKKVFHEKNIFNLNLLLGSQEPVKFIEAVNLLTSLNRQIKVDDIIEWSKDNTTSFSIDIKDALEAGYPAPKTFDSLSCIINDIKNFEYDGD